MKQLRWIQRLFCRRRIIVTVEFCVVGNATIFWLDHHITKEFRVMSNEVTLNANSSGAQTCVVNATVTVNGNPNTTAPAAWSSSDEAIATVAADPSPDAPQQGRVRAVRDPAGDSTRTATITATFVINGTSYVGTGTATVVTQADQVTVAVDFGTPEFAQGG